ARFRLRGVGAASSQRASRGARCGRRRRDRPGDGGSVRRHRRGARAAGRVPAQATRERRRSEEHTSELQSLAYLVCRLLLEKKKKKKKQKQKITKHNRH